MVRLLFLSFLFLPISSLFAQDFIEVDIPIQWTQLSDSLGNFNPMFEDAEYIETLADLPISSNSYKIYRKRTTYFEIIDETWESTGLIPIDSLLDYIHDQLEITLLTQRDRSDNFARVEFMPMVVNIDNTITILNNIKLKIWLEDDPTFVDPKFTKEESELNTGQLFKISVPTRGVYKLDYNFLSNDLGIDLNTWKIEQIKVLSNKGGQVPMSNSKDRIDDMEPIALSNNDDGDGILESNEYIYFFSEGPESYIPDLSKQILNYQVNYYDDKNALFVKLNNDISPKIEMMEAPSISQQTFSYYDYMVRHENELYNIYGIDANDPGSGRRWFGESMRVTREIDMSENFSSFSELEANRPVYINSAFAASAKANSTIHLIINEESFSSNIGRSSNYVIGKIANINKELNDISSIDKVLVTYPQISVESEAWIDFIQINASKKLRYEDEPVFFSSFRSMENDASEFVLATNDPNDITIWDISNEMTPENVNYSQNGSELSFKFISDTLKTFVAFKPSDIQTPDFIEITENQNLHAYDDAELVVIYYDEFEDQALRLAEHRRNNDGLDVISVPISKIYNEFGCGSEDISAVRDFVKMIFERSSNFYYLLLFGDCSYDYKGLNKSITYENFIPTYETWQSLDQIQSFPCDDFYCLLNDNEGSDLKGAIDISVGRLPVRTIDEAEAVVDKLIGYDTDPLAKGDWRLKMAFVADDEDSANYIDDSESLSKVITQKYPSMNIEKIYSDAYQQVSTSGGERYPDVTQAINDNIFRGLLIINYIGHGGPNGWSQERILHRQDFNGWTNKEKLPLFITATCSFSTLDDPALHSAGEQLLLKEASGAIGLFTTVRPVYAYHNYRLNRAVYNKLFSKENDEYLRLGEVLRQAKNAHAVDTSDTNARKFLLLGDPSMKLAFAQNEVHVTSINGKEIQSNLPDTLSALEKTTIKGEIRHPDGTLVESYSGEVILTLFDKPVEKTTLGNNSTPIRTFEVQNNTLFRGKANILNGKFEISFVLPKDINYLFGPGKLSLFGQSSDNGEAIGYSHDVIIGGHSSGGEVDNLGPKITLYMNDENFIPGGITDPTPKLLVKLEDEHGINTSSAGLGHNLSAILNDNSSEAFILNDFYSTEPNDYTKGSALYQLSKLGNGKHRIEVEAWDVYNNNSTSELDFIVVDDAQMALDHVLNFPNPFTDNTNFFFEHTLADMPLSVTIRIFTISGKLVKTIHADITPDGYQVRDISWDGRDDFGDKLANGVYIYKIKAETNSFSNEKIQSESDFEKLFIIR
jgi:hypothetical protein